MGARRYYFDHALYILLIALLAYEQTRIFFYLFQGVSTYHFLFSGT